MPLTSQSGPRGGKSSMEATDDVEILEVHEKHGPLYNAIPCMPLAAAICLCVINIIVPGIGTFFSAFTCLCGCRTKLERPGKAFCLNLVSALLQIITFAIIVGWVWSIIWGMNFISISRKEDKKVESAEGRALEMSLGKGKEGVDV